MESFNLEDVIVQGDKVSFDEVFNLFAYNVDPSLIQVDHVLKQDESVIAELFVRFNAGFLHD